jgi:hypothetical protein
MKKFCTVTGVLIVINVIIFILEELAGGSTEMEVAFNF